MLLLRLGFTFLCIVVYVQCVYLHTLPELDLEFFKDLCTINIHIIFTYILCTIIMFSYHFSLIPTVIGTVTLVISVITQSIISKMDPTQFNIFPNNLIVYTHNLLIGQVFVL
jgi:hypothetical protein